MHRTTKYLLAALTSVLVLNIAIGTASAGRLEISSTGFRILYGEGELPEHIICPITFEGSFHSRAIAKVSGALIGFITRASMNEAACNGGSARFLRETLPWHVRYSSFTGTLPNITSFTTTIIGLGVLFTFPELGEISCLYRTEVGHPTVAIWSREAGGVISSFKFSEREAIPGTGSILCPTGNLIGTTTAVSQLGTTTRLTLRLI